MENPFESSLDPSAVSSVPPARRPAGLTAIAVIALVLGGLGVLVSLWSLLMLGAGSRFQEAMTNMSQGPGRARIDETQRVVQQRIQQVSDRYWWPNLGFALVNVGLASSMVAGGIMALNRVPSARGLLGTVFAVAIFFEIARAAVYLLMQWQMSGAIAEVLTNPAAAPNAQKADAMFVTIMRASMIVGLVVGLVLSLAKLLYYYVSWSYLRRPAVREWFERTGEGGFAASGSGF